MKNEKLSSTSSIFQMEIDLSVYIEFDLLNKNERNLADDIKTKTWKNTKYLYIYPNPSSFNMSC